MVEVIYTGEDFERTEGGVGDFWLSPAEDEVKKTVEDDFLDNMDWVVNLRSLVLIKFGDFTTIPDSDFKVHSLLLNQLLKWVFSKRRKPVSLRRLWIQDYVTTTAVINILLTTLPMTSYFVDEEKRVRFRSNIGDRRELSWFVEHDIVITPDDRFNQLEHIATILVEKPIPTHPREHRLPNLKYARVSGKNANGSRQVN